ncbi:unnamed protein product, partial [Sphacelaria rigidula]
PTVHHFVLTVPRKDVGGKNSSNPQASIHNAPIRRDGGGDKGNRSSRGAGGSGGGGAGRDGRRGSFPLAVDRKNNLVLHAACATVWRRVETDGAASGNAAANNTDGDVSTTGTVAYLPRCVCAMSFDPLFDTLRAVALARGGFAEEGRTLMLDGGGGRGGGGGTGGNRLAPLHGLGGSGPGRSSSKHDASVDAGADAPKSKAAEWGLGDAATLQAPPFPLPILFPPSAGPGSGPVVGTLKGKTGLTADALSALSAPPPPPALLQSISAPESAGWGGEGSSGRGSGSVGGGGWSTFGLPPLMPLDHPVEPLFQALSADNVLTALSALICERPVVVTCSVRSLLSVAVCSLKALLHPLGWHHAYAPLLPAAEVVPFWKAKLSLDRKNAASQVHAQSPARIAPPNWRGKGRCTEPPSPPVNESPERHRGSSQTAFLVGLDADLVEMAVARGAVGKRRGGSGGKKGWVWGVRSTDSCMLSVDESETDKAGITTTKPSSAVLEGVRCMLSQSVHVDLDHDEITWPTQDPATPRSSSDPAGANGPAQQQQQQSRRESVSADNDQGGVFGTVAVAGNRGGAPPAWPAEAAWRARRVMQAILFPEFQTFDAVSI